MKLESDECKKALNNYLAKTDLEKMAIKVLLCKDDEVVNIPGLIDMDGDEIEELANTIRKVRGDIGIDNINPSHK